MFQTQLSAAVGEMLSVVIKQWLDKMVLVVHLGLCDWFNRLTLYQILKFVVESRYV